MKKLKKKHLHVTIVIDKDIFGCAECYYGEYHEGWIISYCCYHPKIMKGRTRPVTSVIDLDDKRPDWCPLKDVKGKEHIIIKKER